MLLLRIQGGAWNVVFAEMDRGVQAGIGKGGAQNLKAFFCFSIFQGGGAQLRKELRK